ncbi:MAG: site-2 protease family protein, partial [Candidatus Pacearchaeota archaeon]|nr:site-2 protease family protein [Candidatus Pacearchaeota archaeon]
ILFFIIMVVFFSLVFAKAGVIFSTYSYGAINSSQISSLGKNLFADGMNLTEVQVNNQTFYIPTSQKNSSGLILAYFDSPALKVGLRGTIVQIDNQEIKESADLKRILETKKPEDIVFVKTLLANGSLQRYNIKLEEKPGNSSQAYIGIALPSAYSSSTFMGKLRGKITFFKSPDTYYKPKINGDFVIFIYNLLWWMVLINLSVALGNMLPLGIFDGGRFFYLTVLGLTKSEKIAKRAFKISTAILLTAFALLIVLWFASL